MVLGIFYVVSTGINLHNLNGIENGLIKGYVNSYELFGAIERAKNISILSNLVGLLIISFLWRGSLRKADKFS